MEEKEIILSDKKFFYRKIGEGPVVVLLHGFGEDGAIWNNQYEALPGFQLVIPDLPGSGGSEMIDDVSMEGLAEWLKEIHPHLTSTNGERTKKLSSSVQDSNNLSLLSKSKVSEQLIPLPGEPKGAFTLIGHSMGGYITLAFAEKYPTLLNGFGLFHSTAYADSEEKKENRRKGIEFIKKHGGYEFLKTAIPNLYGPKTKKEKPELIEKQIGSSNNFSGAALVRYYESMTARRDRTSVLKNSRLPVLFILGKYDNAVPLKDGLEQCSLPDLAYIHVLENAGHMGMSEEPTESNQILLNYLKNVHHQTR